jgi:hypothetical protein
MTMKVPLQPGGERLEEEGEEEGEEDEQLVSPRTPDAIVDPMVSHAVKLTG